MIDILVLLVNLLLGAWLCFVYTDMNYILLEEEVDKVRSSYPEIFRMSPDDIEGLSAYFRQRSVGWRKFKFQYFWNQEVSLGHKNFMYYRYAISVTIVMVSFVIYKLLVLYTGMSPVLDLVFYVGTPLLAWVLLYIPYGTRSKNNWYIKDLKKSIFEIDQALCHREVTTNRKVRDHKYGLNIIK